MRNIVLMEAVSANKKKYQKKYKCPYCDKKFERPKLHIHIQNEHEEMIPEGYTALRVAFNTINHKERGSCIICGNESRWNEDKGRYERLCDNPKCKEAYKQMAAQRNRKKYGTDRLQTDPRYSEEVQRKALAGRRISGEYAFKDGGKVQYVGSYERKCLEFLDLVMHCNSIDVQGPGPAIKYTVKGKEHLYLPDFYYVPYNLIIEIKDGGDNPNNNPEIKKYKAIHQAAKEKAVADTKKYNYVRVVNNDFSQLMSAMAVIKYQLDDESIDPVIMINESSGVMAENNILVKLHTPDKLYRLDAYDRDGEYISPNDIITNGPKAIRFYNSIEEALADMDIRHFAHDMYVHTTVDDPVDFLWYKPKSSNNSGVWVTTDIKVKCIGKIRPYTDGEDLDNLNRFYRWIYRNDNNEGDIKRFTESASINTESNFNLDYFDKSIQEGYDFLNESSSSFINNFLKENNINDAKDLYNWMHKNIKYKSDGIYHSPEEVITSKSGDCHDQAELEKVCLSKLGYIAIKLFMVEYYDYSKPGGATHTLTIFTENKPFDINYKWYWFENAWESKSGIHKLEDSLSPEKMYAPIFKSWRWSGKCDKLYWTQVRANLKYGCDLGEYVGKLTPEKEPKKHIYYKDQSLNESYVINEKDILYNKDKFDSGEINLCFITGHSGSGKSTLGRNMAKDNKIEHYELDDLQCIKDHFTMAQLKEYGDLIYSYFNGPGKKFYITFKELEEKQIPGSEYEDKLFPGFVHYAMQYAKTHKDRKYVIEGVWLFCDGDNGTPWFNPTDFDDYAFYIKGTSMLISKIRAAIRDSKDAETGPVVYSKLNRFAAFSADFVKRNWKYYIMDEKNIKRFRDHFSRLVDRDKIVKESAGDTRLSLRHFKKVPIDENVVKQYKLTHLRYGDNYNGYIFIDKDGELACFVQTEDKSSKIWIQALEVNKKYRSQGLGKQLLDFACKTLKARYLSVRKTNTVAIKMYEKYGFVTYKETDYMYFMKLNRK